MRRIAIAIGVLLSIPTAIGFVAPESPVGPTPQGSSGEDVLRVPDLDGDDTRYAVGFHGIPRDLKAGDEYNGGTVVLVDSVLHFAAVVTDAPALFEARTVADQNVRYLELDPEMHLIEFTPNDPLYSQQYGPQQIRAPEAWDTTLGDFDANVCIVDTGVRYTHTDLDDNYRGGTDVYNGDSDPWDGNGHGTHVAGTVAAGLNNANGIAGLGNVGHYAVKALSDAGSGSFTTIANGIRWCADNVPGNVVISMSLGGSIGSSALLDAVQYAHSRGALLVAAAGNSGPCSNCVSYPAKYNEVIAVTCTTSSESQCGFSSDGPEAELAAPGQGILSTWHTSNTATNTISGTSMSTPHVSGAAALAWSYVSTASRDTVRQCLRDSAQDLGAPGWDQLYGYGEVDAKGLLDCLTGGGTPPPDPQCSDGVDNDGDGLVDYPNDPGCTSPDDDDETDPSGGETLVYSMNFDSGASGWHKSSSFDLWHLGSGCLGSNSPSNSLQFNYGNADCTYASGFRETGWARSPVIDLSGKSSAALKFQHAWETENYPFGAYDVMQVQVSANSGSTWTVVAQWDSRDPNQLSFAPESIDVSAYATSGFRVRFLFDSMDGIDNAYDGWHVDDFEVWAS